MAFTRIKISNLYCFENTELNLSFSRQPTNSNLDGEFLDQRENFYFKKVCIISGANASGKTSFGRVLLGIQNFIDNKQLSTGNLSNLSDPNLDGFFEVDFANGADLTHNRLSVSFSKDESGSLNINLLKFATVNIRRHESCNSTTKRLDEIYAENNVFHNDAGQFISSESQGVIAAFELFKSIKCSYFWHYILSENTEKTRKFLRINERILSAVLMTFDNTIKKVATLIAKVDGKSKKENQEVEGYSVTFENNDKVMIDLDGEIINKERLSRGTYESVKLAHLLSSVINSKEIQDKTMLAGNIIPNFSIYFLDERMAFAHNELEKMMVALIVSKLARHSQFFYTTHNYDILGLDLPMHSFIFSQRNDGVTTFVDASSIVKKNDRKLKNYVINDCFGTLPDLSKLEDIMFED
ncbi:ATP-binding protein [Yersinia enterocolitica]